MKDSILNTGLSAFMVAAILFVAFDNHGVAVQSMTQAANVVTLEKTVVTASRLRT